MPLTLRKPSLFCIALLLTVADVNSNLLCADASAKSPESSDLVFWEELAFWEAIKESKDPTEYEAYLLTYPNGRFARLAEIRIRTLKGEANDSVPSDGASSTSSAGPASIGVDAESKEQAAGAPTSADNGRFQDCDECPEMVVVSAGSYLMGSNQHRPDEVPKHEVTFARPFAIGVYEVTVREWDACLREGACRLSSPAQADPRLPMSNVSWDDAQRYVSWLSKKAGKEYRLPSEAEWEYAASGGKGSMFWWGNQVGKGKANCSDCGSAWDGKTPAPVGSFDPNPFGLYDVSGNLWEWTLDCYNPSYKGAPTDGSGWLRGDCITRVLRGGCWNLPSDYMRTTRRNHYDRDVRYYLHGFRVVRAWP